MSEIKLLPCPFCGGEFHIDVCGMIYIPKCKKCGCELAGCRTQEEAIEEANTRKPMERILTRLEEKKQEYLEAFRTHQDNERYGVACGFGDSINICKKEGGTSD